MSPRQALAAANTSPPLQQGPSSLVWAPASLAPELPAHHLSPLPSTSDVNVAINDTDNEEAEGRHHAVWVAPRTKISQLRKHTYVPAIGMHHPTISCAVAF